jgi:hypothetical protein
MPSRPVRVLAAVSLTLMPVLAAAGQSSVAVSPFVSYVPSAATNPLAGFALTFGGTTGLALRSGGEISISNPRLDSAAAQAGGIRPWAADADAMLFLGGLGGGATVFSRALSPYVFAGIGLTGEDSAGANVVRNGWSYGAGALIPLGLHADIFAEARWRMSEYVMPTSQGAPDSKSAMRFGISFHVGGGSTPSRSVPRRRQRVEAMDQDDVEYVVTPAPASPPVVVVTPAAAEPQVVVVEQQPAPEPVVIVEPVPATAPVIATPRSRRWPATVQATPRQRVVLTPGRTRGASRVLARRSAAQGTQPAPAAVSRRARQGSASPVRAGTKAAPRTRANVQTRTTSAAAAVRVKRAQSTRSNPE